MNTKINLFYGYFNMIREKFGIQLTFIIFFVHISIACYDMILLNYLNNSDPTVFV